MATFNTVLGVTLILLSWTSVWFAFGLLLGRSQERREQEPRPEPVEWNVPSGNDYERARLSDIERSLNPGVPKVVLDASPMRHSGTECRFAGDPVRDPVLAAMIDAGAVTPDLPRVPPPPDSLCSSPPTPPKEHPHAAAMRAAGDREN